MLVNYAVLNTIILTFFLKVKDSNLQYFESSYVSISQTLTNMVQVIIVIIWEFIFRLSIDLLTAHLGSL